MKLKKEVKMIIALLLLLVLLSGGIFVGLKGNIFSSEKDKVVEKSKRTDTSKKNDSNVESKDESENDSEVKDEETLDIPEEKEEQKQEETKKDTQTTIPEVPKNVVIPTPKVEDKVVVVKPTVEEKKEETPTEENPEVPEVPTEPETPKLDIPNGGVLTFSQVADEESFKLTDTVVGVFDTSDGFINSYKETITFDCFSIADDITDETRPLYEGAFKQSLIEELGNEANYYTITSSSSGNIFEFVFVSDRNRLKSLDASEFTTTGFYYYDNFKATYIEAGYTSK